MIRSFKHRGLKRLYEHEDARGIRPDFVDTVQEILTFSMTRRPRRTWTFPAIASTR
jgi:hypothetical protein